MVDLLIVQTSFFTDYEAFWLDVALINNGTIGFCCV